MARMSLRDRFFTPPVARAITSPTAILAAGFGAGVGIVAGGGVIGAVVLALLGFAGRVVAAIPRAATEERIDPFALSEPWRHYVQDALQANRRFKEAVDSARQGPLRDRLQEIDDRVETGVREVWRIARRGHDLVDARRRVDPDSIRREIAATSANADQPWAKGSAMERTMEALRAQLATVGRPEGEIGGAGGRRRLLNARLDEAAARTIELAARASDVSHTSELQSLMRISYAVF